MPTKVPRKQLIPGRWYVGRGRNANVALWTGETFLTIGFRFRQPDVKNEGYYEDDAAQGGCFQPFALIVEGVVTEPVVPGATVGWDAHYARTLDLSQDKGGKQEWLGRTPAKAQPLDDETFLDDGGSEGEW